SRYSPVAFTVRAGQTVRFTLVNDDPITHEFIIGDAATQALHERAPDEDHNGKPGQATIHPGETRVITYTFTSPGTLLFACHRPGHYAYGMRGTIHISA
ncbi:MAG: plastocyanin/azurin family copper-binding protein, partial [Actinomycetota bacterium]